MNISVLRRFHIAPILLLIVCGAVLSWPLWWLGFPPLTDDAKCHIAWFAQFFAQFSAGELYPRWLPSGNAGLGSPAFFYYPPLPSWMASLLNSVVPTGDVWLALGRSTSVALIASGVAMYAWLQTYAPRRWALLAALVFLIGPYRATTDIYLRGALAEHWAFVWLPLMLWATQSLTSNDHNRVRAWCALTAFSALLWMTHPPTAVVFAPVVGAFALFTSSTRSPKPLVLALAAIGCGVLLSAIYLLPALGMERLVWMEEMRTGVFSYTREFLTLKNVRGGLRLHAISLVTLLTMGALCFALVRAAAKSTAHHVDDEAQVRFRRTCFWFAVALFAALMMMSIAAPLYALLPPLQRIQFPYRWLLVVSVAIAPLVADALTSLSQMALSQRNIEYSMLRRRVIVAACGFIALSWMALQAFYVRKAYPQFGREVSFMRYVDWYVKNGAEMPGHRPRDAKTLNKDTFAVYRNFGVGSRDYALAEIVRGQGSVRVVERSPRRIELEISSLDAQNLSVRVRQFNFGAWRAVSNSNVLPISSSVPDGLVLIEVPANTSRVTLEMPLTNSEIWGKNLSLAALTMWMILLSSTWIHRRKP